MLRTALYAAALGALTASTADRPAFAPETGSEVVKRFEASWSFELDELSIQMGGMDLTEMLGDIEAAFSTGLAIEVTDEYRKMGTGRPEVLARTFDAIRTDFEFEVSAAGESEGDGAEVEGALEGTTVVFTWDEEEGAMVASYEDEEGDAELLDGLVEDMDLRVFLPEDDVEDGDTWQVAPRNLSTVVMPGGSLDPSDEDMDPEAEEMMALFEGRFEDLMSSVLDGEVTCTYRGEREEDGKNLAVIEVAVEIDSSTDLSQLISDVLDEVDEEMPEDLEFDTADLTLELEGEGTLLWDTAAGRFHSFQCSSDVSVGLELSISAEGESVELTGSMAGEYDVFYHVK